MKPDNSGPREHISVRSGNSKNAKPQQENHRKYSVDPRSGTKDAPLAGNQGTLETERPRGFQGFQPWKVQV
ncbi:unnamed protein product [Penicillium camemberti]|uniref:Str. FM013 n=1 Tax=Penicillium camemberti (strain FM 013) TaxID=1429867 RepID=A0A0G4PHP0_PENC3|nr:unnamed protein product [Penicillium camemberti]